MKKVEIKCPFCNSSQLYLWEELLVQETIFIKPSGKLGRKRRTKPERYPCGDMFGIQCNDCGEFENTALVQRINPKWLPILEFVYGLLENDKRE